MGIPVKLEVFEGPLDLLLHLIEKNKVDIYDIPIVEITNQYMEYIAEMKRNDLNVMSEFLVMAATLIDIKSRMLLPKKESEEEEEEAPAENPDSKPDQPEKPASTTLQKTYTIQEGDSPWSIANEFGISTQDIIDLNPEVSKTMRVGEVLILSKESVSISSEPEETTESEPEETTESQPEASEDSDTPSQKTYTVQLGDSPWSIANEFGISMQDLMDLNPEIGRASCRERV